MYLEMMNFLLPRSGCPNKDDLWSGHEVILKLYEVKALYRKMGSDPDAILPVPPAPLS